MSKKIYHDHKEKKHTRSDASKRNNRILNAKIANDIKQRNNTLRYSFTDENFTKGIQWFNGGLSLEDAPEELKKNGSFIKGFERGKTIKLVNDNLYDAGLEYYLRGGLLEDAPQNYRNNDYFIAGYEDAMSNQKHR